MDKDTCKIIDEQLERFIYYDDPIYEEDLMFDHKLCEMLYENKYITHGYYNSKSNAKTKMRVGLETSKEIALNFFGSIKPIYRKKLMMAMRKGIIEFRKRDLEERSYFEFDDEKSKTVVYFDSSIEDVFEIVHEFMHYLNSNDEVVTIVTKFYTESFSTFVELMVCDYIVENYPKYEKDAYKMRRSLFESLYQNNLKLKIMLSLIDKKMNGSEVNSYMLAQVLGEFDYNKIPLELVLELLYEFIEEVKGEDIEDVYSRYLGYTVGMFLGCKMYDIAKDEKHSKQIFELSDNLYRFYADEVLTALDLEYKEGFQLEEDGYKELEKIYINQLKKLW